MDYNVLEVVLEDWEETHNGFDLKREKSFVSVLPKYVDSIILEMWNIKDDMDTETLLLDIAWEVACRITDEGFVNNKKLLHFIINNYLDNLIKDEGYENDETFNDTIKRAIDYAMRELLFGYGVINYYTKQHLIRYYKENIDADLINFPHDEVDEIMENETNGGHWENIKVVCDEIIKDCFEPLKRKSVTFEIELPASADVNDIVGYIRDKFNDNVTIK